MSALRPAAILALALLGACSGKSKGTDTGGDGATAADCSPHEAKVRQLYEAEEPNADTTPALRAELVTANVHMVMSDCRKKPNTVAPCLAEAESIADIESRCVIPLDDLGEVEARELGGR